MTFELIDTDVMNPRQVLQEINSKLIEKIRSFLPAWDLDLQRHGPKLILWMLNSRKTIPSLLKNVAYCTVLPSRFLESHFDALYRKRKDSPYEQTGLNRLIALGIIHKSNYSRDRNLSREFSIDLDILAQLMVFASDERIPFVGKQNPVTIPDSSVVSVAPEDVALSKVILSQCSPLHEVLTYKYKNVMKIEKLQEFCSGKLKKVMKKISLHGKKPSYFSEISSIMNDYFKCISMMQRGEINKVTGDFHYKKMFVVTKTGRICEVQGQQGLSRSAKKVIYKDVANLNNYDIRSAQIVLLSHYCQQLNIDTTWIDEYVNNPDAKKVFAKEVGLSIDDWKKTILSVIFGASDTIYGTPFQIIYNSCGKDKAKANEVHQKWLMITEKLRQTCKSWLTEVKKLATMSAVNSILTNAVGVQLDLINQRVSRKFLSSFFLQGLESKIISELILHKTDDYEVVSPEFDGLVVKGVINDEIWQSVLKKCNLSHTNLILENKPF